MLALDNDLLKLFEEIFILKNKIVIDKTNQNLINYLKLPVKISTHQNSKYLQPNLAKQQGNLFLVTNKQSDDDLIKSTKLKIMLSLNNNISNFLKINILKDKLQNNFTATFLKNESRDKARKHIKALLEDASEIKIIDKYIAGSNNVWERINKNILKNILPQKNIDIKIFCQDNDWDQNRENDLNQFFNLWNIIKENWNNDFHDRYIITDKVEIILSSGLSNLDNNSKKDFTYIVKIL